jgi:hypothetical protein
MRANKANKVSIDDEEWQYKHVLRLSGTGEEIFEEDKTQTKGIKRKPIIKKCPFSLKNKISMSSCNSFRTCDESKFWQNAHSSRA